MSADLKTIIRDAVEAKASDILLAADYPITFRVLSQLTPSSSTPLKEKDLWTIVNEILTPDQIKGFHQEKDVDVSLSILDQRLRINLHFQNGSPALAIRVLSKTIPSLDDLGLPKVLKDFASLSKGLVLITGPTGSGKSTTQAALLKHICQTRSVHVITIEDPVEYELSADAAQQHSVIEQREVGKDSPTFASALKHVLRQDPNVILIGEMRDFESIQMALTAAETGHLVISTLHTVDVAQSIDRIIDVFPPNQQAQVRLQLSMVLEGICSQHIFPKQDHSGRVVGAEILVVTPAVRNLIRSAKAAEIYSVIETGKEHHMQSMDDALEGLVRQNHISLEVALPYIKNKERFKKYVSQPKIKAA